LQARCEIGGLADDVPLLSRSWKLTGNDEAGSNANSNLERTLSL
jgi:hypothetical protein